VIKKTYEISNEKGYKQYNDFIIHEDLKDILSKDYYLVGSSEFTKKSLCDELYKKNFYDKYDKDTNAMVYSKYIDNKKFQEKAKFIYSVIDYEKYKKFVQKNENIQNPNNLTITYNIIDSDNTKVLIYNLSIVDISFVF